jgi:hypothetical protein
MLDGNQLAPSRYAVRSGASRPYDMVTIFGDEAKMTIHLLSRVMPTETGRGALDGNQINKG